jgi:hypothetical protein
VTEDATKTYSHFHGNPSGGGSFGRGLRWLGHHPAVAGRVCSALAVPRLRDQNLSPQGPFQFSDRL